MELTNKQLYKNKFLILLVIIFSICILLIASKYIHLDFWMVSHLGLTITCVVIIIQRYRAFSSKFNQFTESHAPEILTTIGISGCFIGLILGFLPIAWMSIVKNENADLFSKIPSIITSVTLSFISSAAGVIAALLIKFKHKKISDQNNSTTGKNNIDYLIEELKQLNKNISNSSNFSLIEEIKKSREEKNEQLLSLNKNIENKMNQLIESFKNYSNKMVENNSNAIIHALNEVVKDFNSNLTGQFGDNFKELNYAVKDLVNWQHQYKDELALMKLTQLQVVEDLSSAAKSLNDIVSGSKILINISKDFKEMIDQLKNNFDYTSEAQKIFVETMQAMTTVVPEFSKNTNDLISDLQLNFKQICANIESHEKNLVFNLQKNQTEMKDLLIETIKVNNQELSTHVKMISEDMAEKVTILDAALETELNRSLESLGRVLGALSEKFVTDYSSITENFRNIINAIDAIKPELVDRVN